MAGTHTAAQLAARVGMTTTDLAQKVAAADCRPPSAGPNRSQRRAAAKASRKAVR